MNIGYKLVKNNMPATAEKAPYLGMAIPVGSLAYDNILREMIDGGTKMSLATARYFLEAFYDYAAKKIAAEAVRINTGTVAIYPMIDGVTKVTDITVSETDGGQLITCQLSAAVGIPKGTYKVRIASHGLDPTAPLSVVTKTVTLIEAVPAPSLPKTAIRELSVVREEDAPDSLMIEMKVDHPEAVLDYEAPGEDTGGTIQLKTRINGGESRVYHAGGSVGSDVWRAMIPEAAQVGDSVEVTLPHNPETTGYDPADAVATTTVKAG